MCEIGPLFALFPTLKAKCIGLIFEKMSERGRRQVLYFFHLYYIKSSAILISKTIILTNEAEDIILMNTLDKFVASKVVHYKSKMNLKIDRILPYPPIVAEPYIFTYLPQLQALFLYPPPPQVEKVEEPNKKKFTFKGNSNAAPAVEEVFVYELSRGAWRTQETKGKIPTRRAAPALACMGPCLMVYGGKQVNPAKELNELYCLNLTTWQWKKLFLMEAPPVCPNSQAYTLNDESLLLVGKQLWVFSAKGVNWQLEKGDLPGGICEKIQGSEISFELKCGTKVENELVIFGWQGNLKAISINLQTKAISSLQIQGQMQGKGQRYQIVNTSQGKGILVDGIHFGSFMKDGSNILFNQWVISQEVEFDKIAPLQSETSVANYGISTKKQLVLVELDIQKQEHYEEQELPNTARQIQADYMKSSFVQKDVREEESPISHSPFKEEQTDSLVQYLGPLLAAEWTKRMILESKSKLLEDSIKRAEKMVLALCRYGGEEEKRIHINKVRKIRESLSESFSRQAYIRKEVESHPAENNLREYVLREYGEINNRILDFQQDF